MNESRLVASVWTLIWAVSFFALVFITVLMAQGHLIYTLDDPSIHLFSLANRILHGGFGINEQEFSSPSSSIRDPLILVPTIAFGFGTMGPILINMVVRGLSVWLMIEFLWRCTAATGNGARWLVRRRDP